MQAQKQIQNRSIHKVFLWFCRDTNLKLWGNQITNTPLTEVNLFTLRHLSSLTFISWDFSVPVDKNRLFYNPATESFL